MAQQPRQIVGTIHNGVYSDGAGGSYMAPFGSPASPSSLNAPQTVVVETGNGGVIVHINGVVAPNPDGTRYVIVLTDTADSSVTTVKSLQCDAGVLPSSFPARGLINGHSYTAVVKAIWGPTLESTAFNVAGSLVPFV